jgi:hypothetical protein
MLLNRLMTYDRPGSLLEVARAVEDAPQDQGESSPLGKLF